MHRHRVDELEKTRLQKLEQTITAKLQRAERCREAARKNLRRMTRHYTQRRPLYPEEFSAKHTDGVQKPADECEAAWTDRSVWRSAGWNENKSNTSSPSAKNTDTIRSTVGARPKSKVSFNELRKVSSRWLNQQVVLTTKAASPTANAFERSECITPPAEYCWSGRGLVHPADIHDAVLDSSPNSEKSSLSGEEPCTLIEPCTNTKEQSKTPIPTLVMPNLLSSPSQHALQTVSEKQVSENYPVKVGLRNVGSIYQATPLPGKTTPQIPTRTPQQPVRTATRKSYLLSRYTPSVEHGTRLYSPSSAYGNMAPRRRCSGRAALLLGITTGSASFVEAAFKSLDEDEVDTYMPVPNRLTYLFNYPGGSQQFASPLLLAIKSSTHSLVKSLIDFKADVSAVDSAGHTLLHQLFLPDPNDMDVNEDTCYAIPSFSPITSLYQSPSTGMRTSIRTPRIQTQHTKPEVKTKCRLFEAGYTGNAAIDHSMLDNKAKMVEVLIASGVDPEVRDSYGKPASDYAKAWLQQAQMELADPSSSDDVKLCACIVRAACLTLLTLEDYIRLKYIAPIATCFSIKSLLKPKFTTIVDGTSIDIVVPRRSYHSQLKNVTYRQRPSTMKTADPVLSAFVQFSRTHRNNPGHLGILEFLGASFAK